MNTIRLAGVIAMNSLIRASDYAETEAFHI